VPSSFRSSHSRLSCGRPNSRAMSSNCENRGCNKAAQICVESSAAGFDQTNPGCRWQKLFGWLIGSVTCRRPRARGADCNDRGG
jgi:hypothetical protein